MNVGLYGGIHLGWAKLNEAIAAKGMKLAGPAYEYYLDGPETPPEKIRTLLGYPVA
jgi:effector-binding domain-containing protein